MVARGGPPTRAPFRPPLPPAPWQAAHFCANMGAPWAEVPRPGGRPVPSGMMWMSQGAISEGLSGLPRRGPSFGPSATAALATSVKASAAALNICEKRLCVNMFDLSLGVDCPTRRAVVVLAREGQDRRRSRGLAAMGNDLRAGRLHIAAFIEGAALQHGGAAVPAPRHAEAREGLRHDGVLQGRLGPALAAVGGDHDLGDAAGA